jgi:hypothetical protein
MDIYSHVAERMLGDVAVKIDATYELRIWGKVPKSGSPNFT